MKKFKIAAALLALATAAGLSGCSACDDKPAEEGGGGKPPIEDTTYVLVSVLQEKLTIKDYETATYNFAQYFRISDNGTGVAAKDYVDASGVKAEVGEYTVTCTYQEKSASLKVVVVASDSRITLSKSEVKLKSSEVDSFDFKAMFSLTVDGKSFAITADMISSDIKAEAGVYNYTVNFFGKSETLKVTVIDEDAIEIINSYGVLELTAEDLEDFDFTKLFSLYVGGEAVKVLAEYVDASEISDPEVGQTYSVTMTFERNGREGHSTAQIKVVEKTQISIISQNIVTYPNGENIDLKSLFTIKNGNQVIEVTDDMVSGTVDYSKEGENTITLNYGGREATATVSVRLGVIIGYAKGDTVEIEKGTDIATYDFGADFDVIINGIRFTDFDSSYFDTTGADFNEEGEYTVKLTVPYNTKALGWGTVNFDKFEKTIKYKVVEQKTEYSIKIVNDNIVLPAGTKAYDAYNNIKVVINGISRVIYENKDDQSMATCYAEIVSDPIDFNSPAEQTVEIDVYVYGPYAQPVRIAYAVRIDNGVEVAGRERVVFSGTTVYARELFTIYENGESVTVTDDMISGKIDLFNAGTYFVTATYKGVTAQSKAVVLDSAMMGTYKTLLTEIEPYEEDDDDVDYDYSWGEYDNSGYTLSATYSMSRAALPILQDLTIDENGDIYLGSSKAEIVSIDDDSTFNIKLYNNDYVFRYEDGIITLDPDNSLRLGYHDRRRPMVYFHEDVWTAESYVQINSSLKGNVLLKDHAGNLVVAGGNYTIDLFKLKSVTDSEYSWYAMKTTYLNKYDSDTYYADEVFGFAGVAPDFVQQAECISSVYLGGESYPFTMVTGSKATINKTASTFSEFAGMTFSGTVDGKTATFIVSSNDGVTYMLDGERVFSLSPNDQNSLKNGGVAYGGNAWLVYDRFNDKEHTPYSYRFSLDKENKTFTLDERDDLFGLYVYGKTSFFFDGYGTGEVCFDTNSKYVTTAFSYTRSGANIEITYINPTPQFSYGKTAKFLFADYKNILTVREISGIDLVGKNFVNEIIYDGAIVKVENLVLGKGSSAEDELYDGISITTKDGTLTKAQMKSVIGGTKSTKYVDTALISFNTPGFYQLKINIPMDGEIKTSYYAVQILDNIYSGNELVGRYSQSAVNESASLILDEFGRVFGIFAGVSYKGSARIADGKFTATAECSSGKFTISGELVAGGVITAIARGAIMFNECFTTGTVKKSGTDGYIFREINVNGNKLYLFANAKTSVGNFVEVEGNVNTLGSILKLTDGSREYFVKVLSWGSADKGLVLADAARGTYTSDGADDLTLDGFGKATLGTRTGDYTAFGDAITVLFGSEIKVFRINTINSTYTVSNTPLDSTLFAGKSFTAGYNFFCAEDEQQPYKATTVFEFKDDGQVIIKSTSEEHDEDCNDRYSPEFATASGTEGTFTVAGNKITVEVNGKTIVFTFTDAVGLNTVKCFSTDVSSSSHGYFAPDTEFTRV